MSTGLNWGSNDFFGEIEDGETGLVVVAVSSVSGRISSSSRSSEMTSSSSGIVYRKSSIDPVEALCRVVGGGRCFSFRGKRRVSEWQWGKVTLPDLSNFKGVTYFKQITHICWQVLYNFDSMRKANSS
jgi:hypothetical protein